VVSAAAIENLELRARNIDLTKSELKGQLEEITRRMREHTWHRIGFGTLLAVVAAGVAVADAVVTGGTLTIANASFGPDVRGLRGVRRSANAQGPARPSDGLCCISAPKTGRVTFESSPTSSIYGAAQQQSFARDAGDTSTFENVSDIGVCLI
jgi:hypothetical protein